jgi:hypothetical protein
MPSESESRSGHTALWLLGALAVFGLAAFVLWVGVVIMPPLTRAQELGTTVPWFITWGLLWLVIAIALAIAGFVAKVGLRSQSTDPDVGSRK